MSHIYYIHKDDFEAHKAFEAEAEPIRQKQCKDECIIIDRCHKDGSNINDDPEYTACYKLYEKEMAALIKKHGPVRSITVLDKAKDGKPAYGSQEARRDYYSMYRGMIWFKPGEGLTENPKRVGLLGHGDEPR